jgi:hypothetical protein
VRIIVRIDPGSEGRDATGRARIGSRYLQDVFLKQEANDAGPTWRQLILRLDDVSGNRHFVGENGAGDLIDDGGEVAWVVRMSGIGG